MNAPSLFCPHFHLHHNEDENNFNLKVWIPVNAPFGIIATQIKRENGHTYIDLTIKHIDGGSKDYLKYEVTLSRAPTPGTEEDRCIFIRVLDPSRIIKGTVTAFYEFSDTRVFGNFSPLLYLHTQQNQLTNRPSFLLHILFVPPNLNELGVTIQPIVNVPQPQNKPSTQIEQLVPGNATGNQSAVQHVSRQFDYLRPGEEFYQLDVQGGGKGTVAHGEADEKPDPPQKAV